MTKNGREKGVIDCNVIYLFFDSIVLQLGHRLPRKFYSLLGGPLGITGYLILQLKHTPEKPDPSIPPLMGMGSSWEL